MARNQYHWKAGEPLHPERLPLSELEKFKASLGSYAFNSQYLQSPLPPEGGMLKRAWLKEVDVLPVQGDGHQIIQSWDTALKAKDSNDYSVGITFLVCGPNLIYLKGVVRERLEFPELSTVVVREARIARADAVLIEDKGSGTSLIQYAKRQIEGVVSIEPHSDKATRMYGRTPLLEGGVLHVPRNAPWFEHFIEEYLSFPNGKHDDQIDALSQFLNWHHFRQGSSFSVDWGWGDEGRPWPLLPD